MMVVYEYNNTVEDFKLRFFELFVREQIRVIYWMDDIESESLKLDVWSLYSESVSSAIHKKGMQNTRLG